MKALYKLACLWLLSSCGTLQKESNLTKHTNLEESVVTFRDNSTAKMLSWKTDSSSNETVVAVIPRGKFTYSINEGFSGEADQLTIQKKVTNNRKEVRKEQLAQQTAYVNQQTRAEKALVQSKVKKRFDLPWLPGLVIAVIAGLLWINREKLR